MKTEKEIKALLKTSKENLAKLKLDREDINNDSMPTSIIDKNIRTLEVYITALSWVIN